MQVSFQVTINKFHTETYLNLLFVFKNMQTTITWLTSLCTLLGGPRPSLLLPLACPSFWFLLWGDLVCDQGHETLQSPCLFNELNSIFLNTWINYSWTSVPSTHISQKLPIFEVIWKFLQLNLWVFHLDISNLWLSWSFFLVPWGTRYQVLKDIILIYLWIPIHLLIYTLSCTQYNQFSLNFETRLPQDFLCLPVD